ncbi:hypothetical protein [Haliovirga abyssi]|uniref:PD-(D/E)XK nuclease family protein n=1 Tax=Haliovirga abyssi TaxID=2996794 RepID=A0AAU9DAB1_9FUSO|nr:hypothetical protein [Haliovirga abyssi]BDU51573.1 hypothetical protein HLVA_21420 [Haliovirga abyssi]
MNIFEALSQGNGQISETNITSFLSFLLNETNDFGNAFLILFLENLKDIEKYVDISGDTFRKKIQKFNKYYTFSAIPEVKIQSNKKLRIVDIVLSISNKADEEDIIYILIENKIKKSAIKKEQCLEQIEVFKNCEDFQKNVPIFSVLITPPEKAYEKIYNNTSKEHHNSFWLSWTDNSINLISIETMIRQLIVLENNLEIAPINNISKYILKSFVEYIANELSEKNKKFNFSILGANVVEYAYFILNSKTYILKRFNNKMIRIYDEDNNLLDEQVKPILRKIIKSYNLNISLDNKVTQRLGREVIRGLNKIN